MCLAFLIKGDASKLKDQFWSCAQLLSSFLLLSVYVNTNWSVPNIPQLLIINLHSSPWRPFCHIVNCKEKSAVSHQTLDFPPNGFQLKFLNGFGFFFCLSKLVLCYLYNT